MQNQPTASFECDFTGSTTPLDRIWEHTMGSCHAPLALRADWQAQMRYCRMELRVRYVRFHGLFCDDMGTYIIIADKPLFSFFNTDQIFDFLVSIGMKPFVELSFMPTGMASGEKTVFHYRANITPPKDYDRRYQLMQKLASHCVDRYGVEEVRSWFFEVWNEPNLEAFGTGKKEDYFKLYKCTVDAIKSVDTHLTVGGPATVADAWITDFGEFCQSNKAQLDFISTHHHPIDTFGKPGDETETQFAASRRSILRDQAQAVVGEARGKPVYYTEWSSSSNPWDQLLDESYAAAFAVKSILEVDELVNGYGYWTFLDIFEENYFPSVPFPGSFWLLNIHGIPKPVYRVYEVLHGLGNELLQVKGSHSTTNVWAVKGSDSLVLLATNYALPRHDTGTEKVRIKIDSIVSSGRAVIARIDDDHANAPRVWREMGNPEYLSGPQLQVLYAASELDHSEQQFQHHGKIAEFEIVIPPQGVAAVTLADIKADHA